MVRALRVRARPHPRDPSPRVAIAIGVLALAAAVASVMPQLHANTWIFRDGRFYVNVATTIVEDLTLDQHAFASSWYTGTLGWNRDLDPGWSNVALGARGEHWPKHPWIHPLIASPVYFALGLPGTLAWNLLMFALIASGLYRFARAYAPPAPAALAVALFVMGTAILQSAYDFSVDVLMLAAFAQGLAAVLVGRGVLAGACIALCVIIKPTALMLMPALVLTIAERRDGTTLRRSLAAGTIGLLTYAGINWWMYGRPWWSGYNRTLVTQGGRPVVADHLDAFATPFAEGFDRMWSGYYGLVHTFTAMVIAAPGLIVLLRRRPLHAIGAILGVAASLLVFAKYAYEGHRFHWPALALLVPSIAVTLEVIEHAARAIVMRMRRVSHAPRSAGLVAAIAIAGGALVALPFGPRPEARVLASGAWGERAMELARAIGLEGTGAAVAVVLVHLVLAGLLAARTTRILERVVPSPIAAFAIGACALVPEVREACLAGGPVLATSALLALGLERLCADRRVIAAVAIALAMIVWAVAPSDGEPASALTTLARSFDEPSAIRLIAPWIAIALPGLVIAARREARTGLALLVLAIVAVFPRAGSWAPITTIALAAPAAVSADAIATWIADRARGIDARRAGVLVLASIAALLVIGGVRRVVQAREPFRVASYEGVRRAVVMHGEVPCDFLAWEHLSWECSHFDSGLYGMVGLAVSDPPRVGGEPRELMVVPTGRSGQERRVIWDDARAGRELAIHWAVPDGLRGDALVLVRVDEREVGRFEVPARDDATIHELVLATPGVGDTARLEIAVMPSAGRRHQATVALDAIWR
ncbi:DUF2029 domain-containing protein [Sandaracinus amylolyticus]|uniref:DUF2029 domain-containing protein n=1 Tax=Sandaracinus amylolyticus TaxID=927083 RepID=UPI001F382601|nr:DUF2029 domain-containing protein [Sandaracinus amylolyticus]UJR79927.1 Hypothetical protein I5071_19670 [Sandaracinus amylolyticus]